MSLCPHSFCQDYMRHGYYQKVQVKHTSFSILQFHGICYPWIAYNRCSKPNQNSRRWRKKKRELRDLTLCLVKMLHLVVIKQHTGKQDNETSETFKTSECKKSSCIVSTTWDNVIVTPLVVLGNQGHAFRTCMVNSASPYTHRREWSSWRSGCLVIDTSSWIEFAQRRTTNCRFDITYTRPQTQKERLWSSSSAQRSTRNRVDGSVECQVKYSGKKPRIRFLSRREETCTTRTAERNAFFVWTRSQVQRMFWNHVSRGIKDDDICRVRKKKPERASLRGKNFIGVWVQRGRCKPRLSPPSSRRFLFSAVWLRSPWLLCFKAVLLAWAIKLAKRLFERPVVIWDFLTQPVVERES